MVSVIIPCYNARQYICEALASAVAQEYVHEVILVDDCSTDDSVACVQAWLDGARGTDGRYFHPGAAECRK